MFRLICVLSVAALAIGCSSRPAPSNAPSKPQLSLDMSLPRERFKSGEIVEATVTLVNRGTLPITVNSRLLVGGGEGPGEVFFRVLGPDSTLRSFTAPINASAQSRSWRLLQPGESVSKTVPLTEYFDLARPGEYHIQAFYVNGEVPPDETAAVFVGRLASGRLVIKIEP